MIILTMFWKSKFLGPVGFLSFLRWNRGSQLNQIVMSILITFPVLGTGMIMGWISPALPLLKAHDGPLDKPLTAAEEGLMSSVLFIVAIPMMFVGGWLADTIGRKYTTLIAALSNVVCWLVMVIWLQSEMIIFGRAIAGIANGIGYVLAPIYVKEMSDDNIRGALGSVLILAQNAGFIISYIIGDYLSFKTVLLVSLLLPAVHFGIFLSAPESPSFLVKQGKIQDAQEVVAWLKSLDKDDVLVVEAIKALNDDPAIKGSEQKENAIKLLWSDPAALKSFVRCAIAIVSMEFCGYLILLTYASEVFDSANVGDMLSPNKQTMVVGAFQLAGSIVAVCVIEKTGRKLLTITTSFLTGVGMLALAVSFFITANGLTTPSWLPIAAMSLSIFCTAAGFQPVPYVLISEMFNFRLRGIVSSICIALTAVADAVQTTTYQPVTNTIGHQGIFLIFTVVCFFATIFTFFFVPETKDKSVEEIYQIMNGEIKKERKLEIEMASA